MAQPWMLSSTVYVFLDAQGQEPQNCLLKAMPLIYEGKRNGIVCLRVTKSFATRVCI